MEHNNKIRQEFRDKTETMVMGYTHDGVPFSSEYVLWLEDELNKLRIGVVSQQRELLNALADNFNESTHTYVGQPMIEETLKAFNCG